MLFFQNSALPHWNFGLWSFDRGHYQIYSDHFGTYGRKTEAIPPRQSSCQGNLGSFINGVIGKLSTLVLSYYYACIFRQSPVKSPDIKTLQ